MPYYLVQRKETEIFDFQVLAKDEDEAKTIAGLWAIERVREDYRCTQLNCKALRDTTVINEILEPVTEYDGMLLTKDEEKAWKSIPQSLVKKLNKTRA